MSLNIILNGKTLFARAWSLTALPDGNNTVSRMNAAMKALSPDDRQDYREQIIADCDYLDRGVIRAREDIPTDDMTESARVDLAFFLASKRSSGKYGVPFSFFRGALYGVGPDIDWKKYGGSIHSRKALERTGQFQFIKANDSLYVKLAAKPRRTLSVSLSCWPTGSSTASVRTFSDTNLENIGQWLRETASNPFVSEGAVVRACNAETQELLMRATIVDGKWKPDDASCKLARYLRAFSGHIGFIIKNKDGYTPAIGRPILDVDDSFLNVVQQREKTSDIEEARTALREIQDDVDDIYLTPGRGMMGFTWLSSLGNPEPRKD